MKIETKCCGTIEKCKGDSCLIGHQYAGAGKCVHCGWLHEDVTTWRAMSVEEMQEAHEDPEDQPEDK